MAGGHCSQVARDRAGPVLDPFWIRFASLSANERGQDMKKEGR